MAHADIDTLIAALHPHVFIHRARDGLSPPGYLRPHKNTVSVRNITQAFATLFGYHPGCDAVAVTIQTAQRSNVTSLSISTSPSIPHGFEENVQEWLARLTALRTESSLGHARDGDAFSPAAKSLILHTYEVCYPAMRRRVLSEGLGNWDAFVADRVATDETVRALKSNEHADSLQIFSDLIRRFAECVGTSSDSLGEDEDVLKFHRLCMSIRAMMSNHAFSAFLNEHIYLSGVQPELTYFSPHLALSTLFNLSQHTKLPLSDQWSSTFLCPSKGTRRFSAAITKTTLAEHFGKALRGIQWGEVEQAFEIFTSMPHRYSASTRYEWDADNKTLSTPRPVAIHPEIALIQHLAVNEVGKTEAYIACSRPTCYASAVYTGTVNQVLKTWFTMDIDDHRWCQLYKADPWILPEDARPEVVAKMREHLLEDLDLRISAWVRQRWTDGFIAIGQGPDLDWEAE